MSFLASWPRRHYALAGSAEAFLFYVVYGDIDIEAPLAGEIYRVGGVPQGLDVMSYGPDSHPEVPDSFREGYLWQQLQEEDPELAQAIGSQERCLVLRGDFLDPATLDYLRDTVGLVTHFLDHGGVGVYDPQMFTWWAPESWKEKLFVPAAPMPGNHTVILVSEDSDETEWIHTRGMRKFGRPDLSIHRVPQAHREDVIELVDRFIEFQALGGVIEEGHEVDMRTLPPGMHCHHRGDLDDPDFNNVHVEIEHDLAPGPAS